MIYIYFNNFRKFGLGFRYSVTYSNYYSLCRMDFNFLVLTVSIVITKFNT